jgi:two-component system CheB/CheR fusion protein
MTAVDSPFIVGVGASAGGIEAFEGLLRPMPADTGMAFVIVAHLAPHKVSMLAEILARFTAMPVEQARDGVEVEADCVYVIPPDHALTIAGGRLRLHALPTPQRAQHPIDLFFESLARDRGHHAIAIVLSGGGSDGTLGIKAIKEHGGLTIAQGTDHSAPRHGSMPSSAIATGLVDLILPVEEIAEKLVGYVRSFVPTAELVRALPGETEEERTEAARREICAILRERVGHEFAGYKEKTFLRRVQRRMQVVQLVELAAYIARLRQDPDEVTLLFRDLLIGVTAFFRDPDAFAALESTAIPALFQDKGPADAVRVWVPGCATGEEVYSIAILLREHMDELPHPPRVQVFGTDIDEAALTLARAARYGPGAFGGISPERLRRFFGEEADGRVLAKDVREMCIFSSHSLIRDPPFSRMDLISCRNLLIYLDADLQARVLPILHYALRPRGFLFLGTSESVSQHADLFEVVDRTHRIFRRREDGGAHQRVPLLVSGPRLVGASADARARRAALEPSLRRVVDARVADRFAPAHVVVNLDGDVVHYSARTGKYLEAASGHPNRQLLAMARKGLRLDLRSALQEAMETRRTVTRGRIAVEIDDRVQLIGLTVEPLVASETDPLFLVLFSDLGQPMTLAEAAAGSPLPSAAEAEAELRETRERLQSMIEEYETALEELKAANEELVSMNEELQSTNEELETSKEEIQSVNEELQTVNQELGAKVELLNESNDDLRNLFDSTGIAVVFLDRNLSIRSYTAAVTSIFSLLPGDHGRPLTDIASTLAYDTLAEDVKQALTATGPVERRVSTRDGTVHYQMRLLPYRTENGEVSGVLATFVDISEPVRREQQLQTVVQELNHRVRNLLAVVSVIARQTVHRAKSPEEFTASFLGRINALSRAHSLLARQRWGDIGLAELLRIELEPHLDGTATRLQLAGPAIQLRPKAALSVGMMIHELGTNAAKHGALSVPEGKVAVTWDVQPVDGAPALVLRWDEADGPAVAPRGPDGFGTELLQRQVQHEWNGSVHADFNEGGVQVTVTLPENDQLYVPPGK